MNKTYLDKVINHIIKGTEIKKENSRDTIIKVPYLPVNSSGNVDSGFYLTPHIFYSSSSYFSFLDYGREIYGLTEDESKTLWKKYIKILRDEIKNKPYKLDE